MVEKVTQVGNGCRLVEDDRYISIHDTYLGCLAKYNKSTDMTESVRGFGSVKGNRLMCYVYPIPHVY